MGPRGWMAALLLAAAAVAVSAAAPAAGSGTPTTAPAGTPSRPSPAPTPVVDVEFPRPPPRQLPSAVNATACLASYRATGNAVAYLCCIDRSMGFCASALEYRANDATCTVDWKATPPPGTGRQCCFRARATGGGGGGGPLRRPPVGPTGSYGAGVAPALDVDCRAYGWCDAADRTRRAPADEAADARWVKVEKVTRCGSWAPAVYQRCQVTLCRFRSKRSPRGLRPYPPTPRDGVKWCDPRKGRLGWGNPAKCCLRRGKHLDKVKCCSQCKGPRKSGFGCCWVGKPTNGRK